MLAFVLANYRTTYVSHSLTYVLFRSAHTLVSDDVLCTWTLSCGKAYFPERVITRLANDIVIVVPQMRLANWQDRKMKDLSDVMMSVGKVNF